MDPQEHSFTRTIDEEAELEERADRDREDAHQEQDNEEEEREHEVMTAGSKTLIWTIVFTKHQERWNMMMSFPVCLPVSKTSADPLASL